MIEFIQNFLHSLVAVWFGWVEAGGYFGVFVLMAMESSIIPVPSEVVMAPAAYWAAQGKMSFAGVVAAGTLGSYAGSLLTYVVSAKVGMPFIEKYSKYLLLNPKKIRAISDWAARAGAGGVFIARFMPVVRHLISIPAGLFRLPLGRFSLATLTGAGIWCFILAWFGREVIGAQPELLQSPAAMAAAIRAKLSGLVLAVLAFAVLYAATLVLLKRGQRAAKSHSLPHAGKRKKPHS